MLQSFVKHRCKINISNCFTKKTGGSILLCTEDIFLAAYHFTDLYYELNESGNPSSMLLHMLAMLQCTAINQRFATHE